MESVGDYTSADIELKAKQLVEARCVEPVKTLTKETSIPHIAVSSESMIPHHMLLQIITARSGTSRQAWRIDPADLRTGFRIFREPARNRNIGSAYCSCNGPESGP